MFYLKYPDEYIYNAAESKNKKTLTAVKSPCCLGPLPSVNVHIVHILTCYKSKCQYFIFINAFVHKPAFFELSYFCSNPSFQMSSLIILKISLSYYFKSLAFL